MTGLTPTEQRIAELVASGRRNAEVAAELGLAVKTVETHLTRIYRKLGVRSRAELITGGGTLRPDGPLCEQTFPATNQDEGQLKPGEGSR